MNGDEAQAPECELCEDAGYVVRGPHDDPCPWCAEERRHQQEEERWKAAEEGDYGD